MAVGDCLVPRGLFGLLCLSLCLVQCRAGKPIQVNLKIGTVQGVEISSTTGLTYFAFKGIPYAQPTGGKLRFKAPQSFGKFFKTFVADKDGPPCPQIDPLTKQYVGDENCLTLNIYTPQAPNEKSTDKFPVVVFIHGGGFQHGSASSDIYTPFKLLEKDIIVVAMNYRLGVLGFMSTADEISPGNFGLLDQLEALRWIQQNINVFGGDVNQVTLLGHEAGAASALFHLISPLSKGLFSQVIALSGSPTCDVSIQKEPLKWAIELGIKLDCYVASSNSLLDCFRKRYADEFVTKAHELTEFGSFPLVFLPVVERVHKNDGDFLVDTPVNLFKEKRVNRAPVILGVSQIEGSGVYKVIMERYPQKGEAFFDESLPELLKQTTYIKHHLPDVSKAIKLFYCKDVDCNDDVQFENVTRELVTDILFRRCNDQTARLLSDAGWPTYMYVIDHTLPSGTPEEDLRYPAELKYLFPHHLQSKSDQITEVDAKMQRMLVNIWANFAKTSMPTPTKSPDLPLTWVPMNPGKVRILKINAKPSLADEYLKRRMQFWNVRIPKVESTGLKKEEL